MSDSLLKKIGGDLGTTYLTTHTHMKPISRKLGVRSQPKLVRRLTTLSNWLYMCARASSRQRVMVIV